MPIKQSWTVPYQTSNKTYFINRNVWHVGFKELNKIVFVGMSDSILVSDYDYCSLSQDEGGPLSIELHEFFYNLLEEFIPTTSLISCRIFKCPIMPWQTSKKFLQLDTEIHKLKIVFNRYGRDPDNIADYIFVGGTVNNHNVNQLKRFSDELDKCLEVYKKSGNFSSLGNDSDFNNILGIYKILFFALDGTLYLATINSNISDIKGKLTKIAAYFNLKLPRYDHILK